MASAEFISEIVPQAEGVGVLSGALFSRWQVSSSGLAVEGGPEEQRTQDYVEGRFG